ncbi:MAG: tetratricopeptide repeat protein [Phycisphaeraceae bacterium]|nr:tetratricopeptide repeat protein [Phycisphaeraceae bacterium]
MKAEEHAARAQRLYQAGQLRQAMGELRAALRFNPQQAGWLFDLGVILEAMGKPRRAASCYKKVLKLRGDEARTLLRLGITLVHSSRFKRGAEALEKVTRLDAGCEPAYCHLILAYAMLGEHQKAEVAFYLARQWEEECPRCYQYLAHSLACRGQWERAIWCWQQVLKLEPDHPQGHEQLGQLFWRLGRPERAREEFGIQLRQHGEDVGTLLSLGRMLMESQQDKSGEAKGRIFGLASREAAEGVHAAGNAGLAGEAAAVVRRAIALDPKQAEGHLILAELALAAGRHGVAETELDRAEKLDPEMPGLRLGRAKLAAAKHKRWSAYRQALRESQRDDLNPGQRLELARLMIELGRSRRAAEVLTPLVELEKHRSPTLEAALLHRGAAWLLCGQTEMGILDCLRLVRGWPRQVMGWQNLALGYLQLGRLERAACCLRRSERLSPENPKTRQMRWRWRVCWLWRGLRRRGW